MAPPPSNFWVVLDRRVPIVADLPPIPEAPKWKAMTWKKKKAYGDLVLGDLTLLSRFDPPPALSALRIRVSDDAVKANCDYLNARLVTTGKGLAIIDVVISQEAGGQYYLICDAAASSLSMIPKLSCPGIAWLQPWREGLMNYIPTKRGDGCQALVALTQHQEFDEGLRRCVMRDLVFLWQLSPSSSGWQTKTPIFPQHPQLDIGCFLVYNVFSCQGMCFWVDLLQGALYCYHDNLLSGDVNQVKFRYINLPSGCRPDPDDPTDIVDYPPSMYRTMACVGGSIKFVTIGDIYKSSTERKLGVSADCRCRVTLWTFMPDLQQWKKDHEFKLEHLCRFEDRNVCSCQLTSPVLSAEDPDLLYLVVHDFRTEDQLIVCIGMHDGGVKFGVRPSSSVNLYGPKLIGSSFFECLDSQCLTPLKRKIVDDLTNPDRE